MSKPRHSTNLGIAVACAFVIVVAFTTLVCGEFPVPFLGWLGK